MAGKAWLLSLITLIALSLGFVGMKGFCKEKSMTKSDDTAVISEKIDEVLSNQQDIIKRLEDIRAQQDIIRVRASR